jgi:hypothetical protein
VNVWLSDLYSAFPGVRQGTHFWSVTPLVKQSSPASAVHVGFEDDAEYLGAAGRMLRRAFVVPNQVREIEHMQDFHAVAATYLLNAEDMTLVSAWSPSAWLIFMDDCVNHGERTVRTLSEGAWSLPSGAAVDLPAPRNRRRAAVIARLFSDYHKDGDAPRLYQRLWPRLALLSAWGDAESEPGFKRLTELFPFAAAQKKGLLATEGIISFPLEEAGGAVAAYTSHFLEFAPIDNASEVGRVGPLLLLGELEKGARYRVVLTTAGGFYRYAVGDVVEVDGAYKGLPVLRFVARDSTSDLVGEKLTESFARDSAQEAFKEINFKPPFALLSPDREASPPCYVLYVECPQVVGQGRELHALEEVMEEHLMENYHYAYARKLGQLGGVRVFRVEGKAADAYMARELELGMRLGNIKPLFLDRRGGWRSVFSGGFLDTKRPSM